MKKSVCFPMIVLLMVVALAVPTTAVHAGRAAQSYQASHVVQAGETLSQIAARYGVTAAAIQAENGLANANRIYVGMVLRIPASGYVASGGGSSTSSVVSSPSGSSTQSRSTSGGCTNPYIIQPGDTLYGVAARCGVPASTLASANGLSTSSMLYVGQRLALSGSAGSTTISVAPPSSSLPRTGNGCSNPYMVTANDTLSSIARLCNVSIANLKQWNGLITDWIWAGQSLKTQGASSWSVPSAGATPAAAPWGQPSANTAVAAPTPPPARPIAAATPQAPAAPAPMVIQPTATPRIEPTLAP